MIRPLIALAALPLLGVGLGAAGSDPLAGYVAGTPQRCINPPSNAGLTVLDAQTLVVRASPSRMYVVRPDETCMTLHATDTLIVERLTGALCSGDRFRTVSPNSTIPSGSCRLGMFTPYVKQKKQER